MTRRRIVTVLGAAAALALLAWIASRTYWAEVEIPTPLRGEARTNPFYAAQRFAESLGAATRWDRVFVTPPTDAVVVLSGWNWTLSDSRRRRLESWVEAGGRLVADETLVGGDSSFRSWSGVAWKYPTEEELERYSADDEPPCQRLRASGSPRPGTRREYWVCDVASLTSLTAARAPEWSLANDRGLQVVRVRVGRGSVTVINAAPFTWRDLLQGDHTRLFADVTELRRGDVIHFLNEDDHPSLLALLWMFGWPSVALGAAVAALALWRGAVRQGPRLAAPDPARRSLAEQIRGIGQFATRFGGGEALHRAAVRALTETASRRIRGYAQLPEGEQAATVARLAGCDEQALHQALATGIPRRPADLRAVLTVLEQARREMARPAGP